MRDFTRGIGSIRHGAHMELPHLHLVLRQSPCFVTQEVSCPSEFFRQCAGSDDRVRDFRVVHDMVRVHSLSHVQIHSKTRWVILKTICDRATGHQPDWNDRREKNQESKDINIPRSSEAV